MTQESDRVIFVAQDTGADLVAGVVPEQGCHRPALPLVIPAGNTDREYVEHYGQSEGNAFYDFSIPGNARIKQRVSEI